MKRLPTLLRKQPNGRLAFLKQGLQQQRVLDRELVLSLLGNVPLHL